MFGVVSEFELGPFVSKVSTLVRICKDFLNFIYALWYYLSIVRRKVVTQEILRITASGYARTGNPWVNLTSYTRIYPALPAISCVVSLLADVSFEARVGCSLMKLTRFRGNVC